LPQEDTWESKADIPQVDGFNDYLYGGVEIDNKIYLMGGYYRPQTVLVYYPETDTYEQKTDNPIDASYVGCVARVDKKIYVFGAPVGSGYEQRNQEYDTETDTWTDKAPKPTGGGGFRASTVNGIVYVIGGYNGTVLSTVEAYDPATDTWSTKASKPTPINYHTTNEVEGKIYAIGGYDGSNYRDVNEVYDPETNTWLTKPSMPTPRDKHVAEYVPQKRRIYVISGEIATATATDINEAYNIDTESWETKKPKPSKARFSASGKYSPSPYEVRIYTFSGDLGSITKNEMYYAHYDTTGIMIQQLMTLIPSMVFILILMTLVTSLLGIIRRRK